MKFTESLILSGGQVKPEERKIIMKYSVRFYNDVTKEIFCVFEMERERFTKRDWDNIVLTLFQTACEGIENRSLFADVYCCKADDLKHIPVNTLGVLTVACETTVDGSTIDAHIFANSQHVRNMNIAC